MFFRWFEHSQVYHPDREMGGDPAQSGLKAEEVSFKASDGVRLHAWFFSALGSKRSEWTWLVCHGNAGNISHRLDLCELLLKCGGNVLLFDYRGYGRSEGRPGEEGTYLDAQAACQWLRQQGKTKIIVFGESLGGGVASELALRERESVRALVLQSTFTSIPDIGTELFPWLPVRWLSTIGYHTLEKLPRIEVPILVMHGRQDTLIPYQHALRNFESARSPKLFWDLAGDHNDSIVVDTALFSDGVERFFRLLETGGLEPAP